MAAYPGQLGGRLRNTIPAGDGYLAVHVALRALDQGARAIPVLRARQVPTRALALARMAPVLESKECPRVIRILHHGTHAPPTNTHH